MKLYKKIITLIALASITISISAFNPEKLTHKIVVGYHFGATAPIPLPREVRSISSYWPQFTPQLGYNVSYPITEQLIAETGITIDLKGMGVQDKVKYMYTNIDMDGQNIKGYFTGRNETTVKLSYITIPVRVGYKLTPTWTLRGGGYFSYRNSSEFSGTVWDGHLRQTEEEDITNSTRILIRDKGDATFDFGKEMRNFDMGVSLGFEHTFQNFSNSRFSIYGDMTYSLTPVFPSDFTGIDMIMRNIYVVLGASYRL